MPKSDDTLDFSGEDNVYEVEKIVGVLRQPSKKTLFRVRWKGYGPEEDTFEPRDHLLTCEDMIDEYLANEKTKPGSGEKEKKKAAKRRHSSDSSSLPDATSTKDPKAAKATSPTQSRDPNDGDNDDEDSDDIDRRALLKDTFWDDLEHGAIPLGLFENDMYSKVKSRRATLDAKKKQQEDTTSARQPSRSSQSSDKSSKSSPPSTKGAKEKVESSPEQPESAKKAKKKRHNSSTNNDGDRPSQEGSEGRRKKKKKKDHKSRKKHRRAVKVDLEAIGSLESATQKSLKMSPSDHDGSDNSANLFVSSRPAEEVLTVAKLEEQSRQSSSNASQSSEEGNTEESSDKSKDKDLPETGKGEDGTLSSPVSPTNEPPDAMSFFGAVDIENILERDPFSMNEDTDSEAVSANLSPKTFQSVNENDAAMSGRSGEALTEIDPGPSLWDNLAKDLPLPISTSTPSSVSLRTAVVATTSFHAISRLISGPRDKEKDVASPLSHNQRPERLAGATQQAADSPVVEQQPPKDIPSTPVTKVKQEADTFPKEGAKKLLSPELPPVKQEPQDAVHRTDKTKAVVVKQESLEIPERIEDHLAPVQPVLDTVLNSQALEPTEELPNLTGNIFDSLMPANSPFTDDEQRQSGSEEPGVDVGRLLSSLDEKLPEKNKATEDGKETKMSPSAPLNNPETVPSAVENPKEVPETLSKERTLSKESERLAEESRDKGTEIAEIRSGTESSTNEPGLEWPKTGPGPSTSPNCPDAGEAKVGSGTPRSSVAPVPDKVLEGDGSVKSKETEDGLGDVVGESERTESGERPTKDGTHLEEGISKHASEGISGAPQKEVSKDPQERGTKEDEEDSVVAEKVGGKDTKRSQNDFGNSSLKAQVPVQGMRKSLDERPEKDSNVGDSQTSAATVDLPVPQPQHSIPSTKERDGTGVVQDGKGDDATKSSISSAAPEKTKGKPTRRKSKGELARGDSRGDSKRIQGTKSKPGAKTDSHGAGKEKSGGTVQTGEPPAKKLLKSSEKKTDPAKSLKVAREGKTNQTADKGKSGKTGVPKAPEKGSAKSTGGKDKERSKKPEKPVPPKLKKKITGGSWNFDCISEIPRNDENKVPLEALDKDETIDEDYLCHAIIEGEGDVVSAILHHQPSIQVDRPNSRGQWPIVLASMGGHNEILKKLILSRAKVDVRLSNGVTPLMIAAEKGHTSSVGILLEAGASVNLANSSGETALIKASRRGHLDIVQLLLHYGADWGLTSIENISALSLAKQHKMYLVSDLLQKHEEKLVEQLEYGISRYMLGTAKLVHSVLPSRCFRIRESTQHQIKFNFDPSKIPFSPTLGTMLFLCHVSPGATGMTCHLTGPCHVKEVTLNGTRTNPVPESSSPPMSSYSVTLEETDGNGFVMEFIPKAGQNSLNITTHSDPYTKMLLLVAAYSLQLTQS